MQFAHLLEQRLELLIVDRHVTQTVRDRLASSAETAGGRMGRNLHRNGPPAAGFAAFHISARMASPCVAHEPRRWWTDYETGS